MKIMNKYVFILMAALFLFACNDDDDNDPGGENEEEEITTVVATFSTSGSPDQSFRYKVEDGAITEQETITLMPNTSYSVSLEFLNEEETPVEDVTEEILAEDDEHLICFESPGVPLTVSYQDMDANGLEVGVSSMWTAQTSGSGTVTITLRHQPDLKDTFNTIMCNVGEVDIEADFPIVIQ